jgi:hypothetical protein
MDSNDLILHWHFRVRRVQLSYYEAARLFSSRHLWLGFPVIILSTAVGTTVFATLQKSAQTADVSWLRILVGLVSVAAAVLASLQTFLRPSEVAEKHRVAGARCAAIKHEIELIMAMPPASEDQLREKLSEINQCWEKLREESPNIPKKIWSRIEKTVLFEDDVKRYGCVKEAMLVSPRT